jgi:hypothetical protein
MAADHRTVAAALDELSDRSITQVTLADNSLLVWVGAAPKSPDAKCLWINPPWRIENESSFLLGSADIPWNEDDYPTNDEFRQEFDRLCDRVKTLLRPSIMRATTLFLSTDLSISVGDGVVLRSFECESDADESWRLSDYGNMQRIRVAPSGIVVERLVP